MDSVALTTGLFSLTLGSPSTLSVLSSDYTDANSYTIRFTGTLGTYTAVTNYVEFVVDVVDNCLSTTVTPSTVSAQSYNIASSSLVVPFSDFTETYGYCTSFTYIAT